MVGRKALTGRETQKEKCGCQTVERAYPNVKFQWSATASPINAHLTMNRSPAYSHLVMHIDDGEAAARFNKAGLLIDVEPKNFRARLGSELSTDAF
jgi:hypothetical protein